jgi:hypothetical protein
MVGGVVPYTKGWQAPWRGEWGPLRDGHSRLGHERRRQAAVLAEQYPGPDPLGLRAEAADLRAIAVMMRARLGFDPDVTPRKLAAVQKAARGALHLLARTASAGRRHNGDAAADLASAILAVPPVVEERPP